MRAKDALRNLENNNIDDETRMFLIEKLDPKGLVLDPKHLSKRCPSCNIAIVAISDKYCRQCGQRIECRW